MFITVPLPTRFLPSACGPLAVLSLGEPTLSANPHHSVQNTAEYTAGCPELMRM